MFLIGIPKIAYPDMMISSSIPYSFMCCSPQPSFSLFGTIFFFRPVKFGVWYILMVTLSSPNSSISGASREAHEAFGVSLVPRRASESMETLSSG
jgi:hypothetical protein